MSATTVAAAGRLSAADVAREEPPLAFEPAAGDDVLVRIARKEAELQRRIVGG